jgi:hypothetical protein
MRPGTSKALVFERTATALVPSQPGQGAELADRGLGNSIAGAAEGRLPSDGMRTPTRRYIVDGRLLRQRELADVDQAAAEQGRAAEQVFHVAVVDLLGLNCDGFVLMCFQCGRPVVERGGVVELPGSASRRPARRCSIRRCCAISSSTMLSVESPSVAVTASSLCSRVQRRRRRAVRFSGELGLGPDAHHCTCVDG